MESNREDQANSIKEGIDLFFKYKDNYEKDRFIKEYDRAKAKCVHDIYNILNETIKFKEKLAIAKKNATDEYCKLYWNRLADKKKYCNERFELIGRDDSSDLIRFLTDEKYPNVDLKSLKYLFIHHFFNITAETDLEAAECVKTMAFDCKLTFPIHRHLKYKELSSNPCVISATLRYDPDLAAKIKNHINTLYPELKIGDRLIQLLTNLPADVHNEEFCDSMEKNAWNVKAGVYSMYPPYQVNTSVTQFYLFYNLFDSPFKTNVDEEMKDVHIFLSQAIKNGIKANSLAFYTVFSLLNNSESYAGMISDLIRMLKDDVGSKDDYASLLVEKFHEVFNQKFYPNYRRYMFFKHLVDDHEVKLPYDVKKIIAENLRDVKIYK